jgi:chromate reductase
MADVRDVVVLVGSLRKESFTRKIAVALTELAPPSLKLELLEIRNLPLYDQDLEASVPASWQEFRRRIKSADAVLFATPEYNRSIPGALKNAIDVASRPYGQNMFDGKPAAVISVSPGALAGFGANHHIRQCLVFVNMPVLQQPEAYVGGVADLLNPQGKLVEESTREFLKGFMTAFAAWIEKQRRV